MPTFARSDSGKWHVVGPDGCRYGQTFGKDDTSPDRTVTATDIVAYDAPNTPDDPTDSDIDSFPRGQPYEQRLVLPSEIEDSETALCGSCRSILDRHKRRRSWVITDLKRVTTRRDIDWNRTSHDDRRACDWCRSHEFTTAHSETLGSTVCQACQRLFEAPLGEPSTDEIPDGNQLPKTPSEPVTPIVLGTTLPEYDPTALGGSNRPLIKYREKSKYAELVFDLERTGHAFSADGLAALETVREEYADRVASDDEHQTDVTLDVGQTPRTVTLGGIFPDDRNAVIDDLWDAVSDPSNWFPIGWPRQGFVHFRAAGSAVPGTDSVVQAFPRLETQQPASTVDTETLRSLTDPGRYERGKRYYERGAVTSIERVDESLQATVQGSRPYEVAVTLSDGSYVEGRCSCPDDAGLCKHIVAAVLASGDVDTIHGSQPLPDVLESASAADLRQLLRALAADDLTVRKRIYDELE